MLKYQICSLILFAFFAVPAQAKLVHQFQSEGRDFEVHQILQNQGVIWAMDFISQDEMIFTERAGSIFRFNIKTGSLLKIKNPPEVVVMGQGGLLDVQTHPDFSKNSLLYFTYSVKGEGGASTRLARAKLNKDKLENLEVLFTAEPFCDAGNHFGSRVVFDREGYLFLSIGDRTERDLAQSLETHNGKIIRLHDEGRVPKDNPFVNTANAKPEIWSYGHRNIQGMAVHPVTGDLWAHEHGPRGGDEVNLIKKGANYGWPVITYGKEYWGPKIGEGQRKEGMEQPVKFYVPSIAPSGFEIYASSQIPEWKNSFFIGALALTHLNRLKLDGERFSKEERLLKKLEERIRDIEIGPDALVYLSTDSGKIFRIQVKSSKL